jgi:hypothetical protein
VHNEVLWAQLYESDMQGGILGRTCARKLLRKDPMRGIVQDCVGSYENLRQPMQEEWYEFDLKHKQKGARITNINEPDYLTFYL